MVAWRSACVTAWVGKRSIDQSVHQVIALATYVLIYCFVNGYQWWHDSSLIAVDWLTHIWSICQWWLVHLICTLCQLLVYFGETYYFTFYSKKNFLANPNLGCFRKVYYLMKYLFWFQDFYVSLSYLFNSHSNLKNAPCRSLYGGLLLYQDTK